MASNTSLSSIDWGDMDNDDSEMELLINEKVQIVAEQQARHRASGTVHTNHLRRTTSTAPVPAQSNPRRSKRLRSQENDDDTNNNDADSMTTDDNDDDSDGNSVVPTPTVVEFVKRRMRERRARSDGTMMPMMTTYPP